LSGSGSPAGEETGRGEPSPVRGLAGLIAANVSFFIAVLFYMGWAYDSALYGYFHLTPAQLGFGVPDYLLASRTLLGPYLVIAAAVVIAGAAALTNSGPLATAAWAAAYRAYRALRKSVPEVQWLDGTVRRWLAGLPAPLKTFAAAAASWLRNPEAVLGTLGGLLTAGAFTLAVVAQYARVSTYLLIALLASGPLLLTRALKHGRKGIFPYTLAAVVTAVCIVWAGALYAHGLGARAAQGIATHLAGQTAVAVYAAGSMDLSGPGITVTPLPAGSLYRYRYEGFRLLYMNSGTYYLISQDWIPQLDLTYVLQAGDQTMFELYAGQQRTSYDS
jgi:hypothetical protein